jgi:TolB-like protein/tetratricopeptide (TPR) repeat protein
VWAFGCVLYEALTGRRAFAGGTLSDTLAIVLQRDVDWEALPDGTPEALRSLLQRCLQKDRDHRLHDIADARLEIDETLTRPIATAAASGRPGSRWVMVLFAVALMVTGLVWWSLQRVGPSVAPGEISSLAVLPLTNLMNDPEQEYFVDGMQEELIIELSHIKALRVISRTSTMQYKNTEKSLPEIAEELQVDALVEGSVLRSEDEVRITLQLVALEPERHLWSSRYDRQLSNILALHSEVARAVAREIGVSLAPEEQALLSNAREINPEAYDAYLKGTFYWRRWTPEGIGRSAEWFQRSIAMDPDYAPAWAGLSQSLRFPVAMGIEPGRERLPVAHEAALRAVELDSSSAEARVSLGMSRCLEWNWFECEQDFQQALELDPNYAHGHHAYSNLCLAPLGRLDEALAEIQRARELDPLSLPHNTVLGRIHYYRGEYDQSIEQLSATIDLDQGFPVAHLFLGDAYREKGLYRDAVEVQEKAVTLSRNSWFLGHLGSTYVESGRRNEALTLVRELEQKRTSQYVAPHAIAMIYASLGEIDRAFEWLDKAYEEQDVNLNWFVPDPLSDSLRSDPRFEELLRKMRLPEEAIQRHLAVH